LGGPELSLVDSITDWFAWNDIKMPRIRRIAEGILDIVKLQKELGDKGYELKDLYRYYLDNFGEEKALEKLLERLMGIREMGEKKAITFLRGYSVRSGEKLPIEKLSLPRERHVQRVMKRIGFVDDEDIEKIREAGCKYFKVPIIADLGLWFVGKNYCYEDKPKCEECPVEEYCAKNI